MLYIYLTTTEDRTFQYIIQDRTDYSIDYYVDSIRKKFKSEIQISNSIIYISDNLSFNKYSTKWNVKR